MASKKRRSVYLTNKKLKNELSSLKAKSIQKPIKRRKVTTTKKYCIETNKIILNPISLLLAFTAFIILYDLVLSIAFTIMFGIAFGKIKFEYINTNMNYLFIRICVGVTLILYMIFTEINLTYEFTIIPL